MSDEINVLSRTQIIYVEPSTGSVSVINAGPPGPSGSGGGGGGSGFPITEDDALNTYTVDVISGIIRVISSRDASLGDDVASVTAATGQYTDDSAAGLHASTASLNAEFQVMVSEASPNEPTFRFSGPFGIAQLVVGSGNPNVSGLNAAYKGSLYLDCSNAKLYQNTNGATAWALVGDPVSVSTSVSGAVTVNYTIAQIHRLLLTGNITGLTLSGTVSGAGASLTLYLVQDSTGSRTVVWPSSVKWPGGTAPVLSTAPNSVDLVVMETFDGGTTWYANLAGKNYA